MKIRTLSIKNFKGIKSLDWTIPDTRIICIIGKGDTGKTSILEAIRWIFHPHWNLTANDSDFFGADSSNPIIIESTVGELSDEFLGIDKYASELRGWNKETQSLIDEPDDGYEPIITARLTISHDLEPKWVIYSDRNPDGIEFRAVDRAKIGVNLIGSFSERQFSWGKGTAISRITDELTVGESLANAARTARTSLDEHRTTSLASLDAAAKKAQVIANNLGIFTQSEYKANLDLQSLNISTGGISIHDGDIPLRQLGLGSRRMILCGIQNADNESRHITLVDEIELGLEPHRIARLLNSISKADNGSFFITTHSPTVLKELTINELNIVHSVDGIVSILHAGNSEYSDLDIQGKIRSSAEAFLSKKIMICEGATEVGFLRGLDKHASTLNSENTYKYAALALLDANGAGKISAFAKALKKLNYDVAVFGDSDSPENFHPDTILELRQLGISCFVWEGEVSIEERVMLDLPWERVLSSIELAGNELEFNTIQHINSATQSSNDPDLETWIDSVELRRKIGKAANKSKWYKRISNSELWFGEICDGIFAEDRKDTRLRKTIDAITKWIIDE